MRKYTYNGPVFSYDNLLASHWQGETMAVSESKARSNLIYQYKKKNNLLASANIKLTGVIKEV